MSVEKRLSAYLELAAKDAEAAELLLAGGNRYSAYHLQQAVEKVTKALLLARGVEAGVEHRLEELFKRFPPDDEWPARLLPFVGYSAYATAFRYPTPGGRIPSDPPAEAIRRDTISLGWGSSATEET
jgi:HEPN domain-containing protein